MSGPTVSRPRTASTGREPSRTPSSTRGTCCTPTAPPPPRTRCGGSSACSARPEPRRPAWARRASWPSSASSASPPPSRRRTTAAPVRVILRFLQLQTRRRGGRGPAAADGFTPVPELSSGGRTWLTWDEAAERSCPSARSRSDAGARHELAVEVPAGRTSSCCTTTMHWSAGWCGAVEPLAATVAVGAVRSAPGGRRELLRLEVAVRNRTPGAAADRDAATARSFPGAHLMLVAEEASFVSVVDPPAWAAEAAAACRQRRCWPVLAGDEGETAIVLGSPIILYDHPAVAPESAGALFDSTEIDEILTLRVMTLTDEEKAAARATDPRAAAVIDRCDGLSPEELQRLHGILRDPRADVGAFPPFRPGSPAATGTCPGGTPPPTPPCGPSSTRS